MTSAPIQPVPLIMTVDEAAALPRCEPKTVVNYIHGHQLDAIQIGDERRIRGEDLLRFVEAKVTTRRTGSNGRGR